MNISKLVASLLAFTILCAITQKSAYGDDAFIYGRVELEGPPASKLVNPVVGVSITYEKPPQKTVSKQDTKWELYSFRVPTEKNLVRLIFVKEGYQQYITEEHYAIEQAQNHLVKPVTLPLFVPKKRHASGSALLNDIKQQVALFDISKSYDVLQYNLACLRYAYRNAPELSGTLKQFLVDSGTQPFMSPQYSGRQELYLAMVRRNNGENVVISQSGLLALMKDELAFPGIRANAIASLAADGALETRNRTAFLEFLHAQTTDPSALLFRPARAALAKVGNAEDIKQILDDLSKKDDLERHISALIAVKDSRLDVATANPETAAIARAALDEWDAVSPAPLPSRIRYVWKDGAKAPGLDIATFTDKNLRDWWSKEKDNGEDVLRVEYPANQGYGLLQIMVHQPGGTEQTLDVSEYTELVVEMKSIDPDENVDIGIKGAEHKGPHDPATQTKFKRTFTDVSTEWQLYHLPLKGAAAQLSPQAAANQIVRLQNLKIVTELAFGSDKKQVFYIRNIYFARP